jgi:hypothetical protein
VGVGDADRERAEQKAAVKRPAPQHARIVHERR